jgi:hypothetical protein
VGYLFAIWVAHFILQHIIMKRTRGAAMPLVLSLLQMETILLACKQNAYVAGGF